MNGVEAEGVLMKPTMQHEESERDLNEKKVVAPALVKSHSWFRAQG